MQVKMNRQELGEHVGRLISSDRNSQHGDPHMQFAVHSMLMDVVNFAMQYRLQNGLPPLNSTHRHAVTMDLMKTSRILVGNPDWQDHWLDKAGYSLIGAEACSTAVVVKEVPDPEPPEMTMKEAHDIMAAEELLDPTGKERDEYELEPELSEDDEDPDNAEEVVGHGPNAYDPEEVARLARNAAAKARYHQRKSVAAIHRTMGPIMEAKNENPEVVKSPRAPVHGEDGERSEGVRWGRRRYGRPSSRSESPVGTGRRPRKPDHK